MRYTLSSLFLFMLLAVAAARPQEAEILGPHNVNGHGCASCHSSHSGGGDSPTNADYLWGVNFVATTYRTAEGGTLTIASSYAPSDPLFHTAACLSCHDGSVATAGMTGQSVETVDGRRFSTFLGNDSQSLANDHPVHVVYECTEESWPCTVEPDGTIVFSPTDAGTLSFSNTYGRPLRFYGYGGRAYVECSTCHNPHALNQAIYRINGVRVIKPTRFFLRGWYDAENHNSNSTLQFCRACHYTQSNEFYGTSVPAS